MSDIRGRFVWYENLTKDVDAAIAFYRAVIGWNTRSWDGMGEPYHMFANGDAVFAGLMKMPPGAEMPPYWMGYIGTPDVKATTARAEELGAKVWVKLMEIPGEGTFSVIQDPQGAGFAAYTPVNAPPEPAKEPVFGTIVWHELITTDVDAAWAFYSDLFGWKKTNSLDMGPAGIYQMFGLPSLELGGIYKKSAEMNSTPNIKKLALEYLVAAYGPDKLNDPAQSEPIVQQMINLEPTEPTNYFALAKIYEDNGDYEKAEATYLKAKEVKPDEPTVYTTLAGYYNRQGDFDKTIDALQQRVAKEPNNPEAHHMVATFYWDKVYRDFRLADADKRRFVQSGIESVDKAIALKDDYVEAITYKNLLLRLQANLEKDVARQRALLQEADRLRDQALEIRKKQQAGA